MRVLLTNDDGIDAPGLKALWKALRDSHLADIEVVAPAREQSGTGVSITWDRPVEICEHNWEGTPVWSVDGTPADCVKMGSRIILDSPPDLVVSGINAGSNAGRNVLHSGTVGAVIEGVLRGIPGVALSCEDSKAPNFHVAEKYVEAVLHYVIDHPLPAGSFLNVNFPKVATHAVKGFRLTRQGRGRWSEDPSLHLDAPSGQTYWIGGKPEELVEDDDSDIALLRAGYMTAVPIHVHELTDRLELAKRQAHFETFFLEKRLDLV